MKAAVLYEPNKPLEIVELEQQGPQAGEARVRVKAAGVCHSDWHIKALTSGQVARGVVVFN